MRSFTLSVKISAPAPGKDCNPASFNLDKISFVDDFSTWYVRRSRDRVKTDEAKDALSTLKWTLREYAKVAAPFTPFISDWIWMRMREDSEEESVHLCDWGEVVEPNREILTEMSQTREVVSAALENRARVNIKVRQPLQALYVQNKASAAQAQLIKEEVNVKEVIHQEGLEDSVELNTEITPELQEEGMVRDIVRSIQGARKENNLALGEKGEAAISGTATELSVIEKNKEEIEQQTDTSITIGSEEDEFVVVLN